MSTKQIPALPPLDEAPADDDRFALRDTSSGSDKSLRVDRLLERSAEQVSEHATETGGIHGIPEGERALHTASIRAHDDQIEIIAHRGFRSVYVQNTLPALIACLTSGARAVEFDIKISAEGTPYVFHDESVDALTNGSGVFDTLGDSTIDSLRYTKADGTPLEGVGIPTLESVVSGLKLQRAFIVPEIKGVSNSADIEAMVSLVKQADMSRRCLWQSFSYDNLLVVRSNDKLCEIGFLLGSGATPSDVENGVDALLEDFGKDGGASIMVRYDILLDNPHLVSYARSRGIGVGAWTVNDFNDLVALTEIGVYRIITDENFTRYTQ